MTIKEYIENPMGRGDASLGQNRKVIVDTLMSKYENLTSRKEIKMKCYISQLAIPTKFYIHLTIPSETERDNTYDVIFEFTKNKEKPMVNWDVRVFANSPSFAYTFAYVYLKHDLMIKSLAKKLGKEFIKVEPTVRNKYQIVTYEKYVFFGAKFIIDSKILGEDAFSKKAQTVASSGYPGKVRTLQEIMKEYDVAAGKLARKKRQDKKSVEQRSREKKEIKIPQKVQSGITVIAKKSKKEARPSKSFKHVERIGKK